MSAGMPADLMPVFEGLHRDLVGLYARWQMFKQLFDSGERRRSLLAKLGPAFFGLIEVVLLEDVLSGAARITDRTTTCGKDNLVLRQLLEGLDAGTHASLVAQLTGKQAAVESACATIREIRHKVLSHRDYGTALDPQANPLPTISVESVEKALAAIADLMNSFQHPFTNDTIMYAETITGLGDADGLVRHLRRAVEHLKLQGQGKVPPVGGLSSEYEDSRA